MPQLIQVMPQLIQVLPEMIQVMPQLIQVMHQLIQAMPQLIPSDASTGPGVSSHDNSSHVAWSRSSTAPGLCVDKVESD